MNSNFSGNLIVSNSLGPDQQTLNVMGIFSFTQQSPSSATWDVSLSGLSAQTFPISAAGYSVTVTATPGSVTGIYSSQTGGMTLTLPLTLDDGGKFLPSGGQLITFPLATSGTLTAGVTAQGSPLNVAGGIALVGSANVTWTGLGRTGTFALGIQVAGTIAAPLPPNPGIPVRTAPPPTNPTGPAAPTQPGAINRSQFDTDLTAYISAVNTLISAVQAKLASVQSTDLTTEDQQLRTALSAVAAEQTALTPNPPPS